MNNFNSVNCKAEITCFKKKSSSDNQQIYVSSAPYDVHTASFIRSFFFLITNIRFIFINRMENDSLYMLIQKFHSDDNHIQKTTTKYTQQL